MTYALGWSGRLAEADGPEAADDDEEDAEPGKVVGHLAPKEPFDQARIDNSHVAKRAQLGRLCMVKGSHEGPLPK